VIGGQKNERDTCGEQREQPEHAAKRLKQVGDAPGQRPRDQPHQSAEPEQNAELFRSKPARFEKARPERRRHSERRVHQRIKDNETRQCTEAAGQHSRKLPHNGLRREPAMFVEVDMPRPYPIAVSSAAMTADQAMR
jgi:hypothetical protein